jgi:hypothetical protein
MMKKLIKEDTDIEEPRKLFEQPKPPKTLGQQK